MFEEVEQHPSTATGVALDFHLTEVRDPERDPRTNRYWMVRSRIGRTIVWNEDVPDIERILRTKYPNLRPLDGLVEYVRDSVSSDQVTPDAFQDAVRVLKDAARASSSPRNRAGRPGNPADSSSMADSF